MADETSIALQHLGLLNKQFSDALSPINNFASQNAQLAIGQEKARQEQANKIAILQHQAEADRQHQEASMRTQFAIARMQESGANDRGLAMAKFNAGHEDAVRLKAQADSIRGNPQARRIPGLNLAQYADSPEGNAALVSSFTTLTSDPKVLQALDVEEARGLNQQMKSILDKLNSTTAGTAQSKQAILTFLATPGVSDLLIKKGNLTPTEIQSIVASGDPAKVTDAINRVVKSAWFERGEKDYAAQLSPAWVQAQITAGATPSAEQSLAAMSLKGLATQKEKLIDRGNLYDPVAIKAVWGDEPPVITKLPPPPGSGIVTPVKHVAAPVTDVNPFAAPPLAAPSDKIGLAKLFDDSRPSSVAELTNAIDAGDRLSNAFVPQKYASDPHTEYAIRKSLLERERVNQAAKSGFSRLLPGKTFVPTYDAFKQSEDEQKLQSLVQGLYSAPSVITPPPNWGPQAPIAQPHPYSVPQIQVPGMVPQIQIPTGVPQIRF